METVIITWINSITDLDDLDDITNFGARAIEEERKHPGKAHVTNEIFPGGADCSVLWVGDTPPTNKMFIEFFLI